MHVPHLNFKPFHAAISDGPCIVVRIAPQVTLSIALLLASMFECYTVHVSCMSEFYSNKDSLGVL